MDMNLPYIYMRNKLAYLSQEEWSADITVWIISNVFNVGSDGL